MTMFFRKKSEDPWDREPQRSAVNLAETAEESAEAPTEESAEPEKAEQTAMRCPWCGKEMQWGELRTSRPIWWVTEKLDWKNALIGYDPHTSLRVDDEGMLMPCKTAWYCADCRKMVIDTTGMRRPYENETDFDAHMKEKEQEAWERLEENGHGTALF